MNYFPDYTIHTDRDGVPQEASASGGFEIRDNFAGIAMSTMLKSLLSETSSVQFMTKDPARFLSAMEMIADLAYTQADIMVKARNKEATS